MDHVETAIQAINQAATTDELQRIQDATRARWSALQRRAKSTLVVGDRVTFTTRKGRVVEGEVTQLLRKNVKVLEWGQNGRPSTDWKVAPSLLTVF